jgi:hypothetical protein
MGKMKALLIDNMENVETYPLSTILEGDQQEEAHYHHVMNDFVSLIKLYGWETVIGDLRAKMGQVEW